MVYYYNPISHPNYTEATTQALGEEGGQGRVTSLSLNEEGAQVVTTFALGEEGATIKTQTALNVLSDAQINAFQSKNPRVQSNNPVKPQDLSNQLDGYRQQLRYITLYEQWFPIYKNSLASVKAILNEKITATNVLINNFNQFDGVDGAFTGTITRSNITQVAQKDGRPNEIAPEEYRPQG